jgi:Holliday junction resolvasome RuvABC endonuclease subunit
MMIYVLGIDSGSKESGWCVLRFEEESDAFELGSRNVLTNRPPVLVDCGHAENTWVEGKVARYGLIGIESPEGIAFKKKGGGVVPALLKTTRATGGFSALARFHGATVFEATANRCRQRVVGNANASDAKVKAWVYANVLGWPKRSNSHMRDAAVAAIYAARIAWKAVAA